MCSSNDIAAVLVKNYIAGTPEDDTYRSVPLAPLLIMVGLPRGTTEGLQYRLKSGGSSPIEQAA